MRRFAPALLLLLIAIGGSVRSAIATQVQHFDTRQLTSASTDVVIGTVEKIESRYNQNRTKIFTDVQVRVSRSLKGGGDVVTLSQLGGTVGNLRYDVPGCPTFATGEEAMFFVWRDARGQAQLTGLGQGKFEIRRDAAGHGFVQRSVAGLGVTDLRRLSLAPAGQAAPASLSLDDLIQEVQTAITEGGR